MAVIPVAGVSARQLQDTFGAPRSGGRKHAGIDIFAPRGTPVVAAAPGTVIRAVSSNTGLGGLRVTVRGDDGRLYYYAHLNSVGVRQGARVGAGQRLGTVGNTGNARGTPPHLHFSVGTQGVEDGSVNAYAWLTGQGAQSVPGGAGGHAGHDHGGGGVSPQQQDAERIQAIEDQSAQAAAAHQNRMLQFMEMMTRQNQGRGRPIPVRSAVQVDERQFDPSGVTERLRRLAPQDLTPGVARRAPVDRAAMLKGMGQQLSALRG